MCLVKNHNNDLDTHLLDAFWLACFSLSLEIWQTKYTPSKSAILPLRHTENYSMEKVYFLVYAMKKKFGDL